MNCESRYQREVSFHIPAGNWTGGETGRRFKYTAQSETGESSRGRDLTQQQLHLGQVTIRTLLLLQRSGLVG